MPGSDVAVPVMSLGDELTKLSISGKRREREVDPVAEATKNGKVPTLGEVKRSLKASSAALPTPPPNLMFSAEFDQEPYPGDNTNGRTSA